MEVIMVLVFLADDDILTLNRLRNIIDWNKYGFDIIGQAQNGADTLHQVEILRPDILILDVDMPDKSGVEVAKAIQTKNLNISILILSNYNNFEFVRDTMRYGARDYLLKHQLDPTLLLQKLTELQNLRAKEGLLSAHIYFFTTVAKQQYLKELVQHGVTNPQEQEHMMTQKDYSSNCNLLVVMQITNFVILTHLNPSLDREKLVESVLNLATSIFVSINNGIITHLEHGQFVILFHYDDESSSQKIHDLTNANMRMLLSNMQKLLNITALYQCSDIISDIKKLNICYNRTVALLNNQSFNQIKEDSAQTNSINIIEEKKLMDALMSLSISQTEQQLKQIFKRYANPDKGSRLPQQMILQLLQINQRFQQNLKHNVPYSPDKLILDQFQQQLNVNTYQFIFDYYKSAITEALQQNISGYSAHVQKAILYIRENYANNISLVIVADQIHVSNAHLSRLFKKELNTSFIDYLTSYRIELAKKMMKETNKELKEISELTGFNSYNYFLRVYKEKTGLTPTQELNRR
jgi:YesN/AraC family two-component response regulator